MKRIAMIAGMAGLLAGCSDSDKADADGSVAAGEAADLSAAETIKPQPGFYRATMTMTGIDIPGMPPEMAGHGAGATTTSENCLTQEDVDKGFEELMKQGQNGECSYERFKSNAGTLDAVMVCKTPDGDARMEMTGTATATSADVAAKMAMNFDEIGPGTMSFTVKHERIGECPAQE